MGSVVGFDVEETIFVAVGKNVEKSRSTLFWALRSFPGKRICLLYVHKPSNFITLNAAAVKSSFVNELEQDAGGQQNERETVEDVLNQYNLILVQQGVRADKVLLERDSIEEGIVEIINLYEVRWLVMGAAANKLYSKKLAGLKSKKAIFVCHHAPISCHIWFACNGFLIFTREGQYDTSETENALYLPSLNAELETEPPEHLKLEPVFQIHTLLDAKDDELDGMSESSDYQCAMISVQSTNTDLITCKSPLITTEEEKNQGRKTGICCRLEEVIIDAKDSKQKAVEETAKRWREEDNAIEAKCKAKASERLCIKEITLRKEMEEALDREKQEVERTKNERDKFMEELQSVRECKSVLESQLAESQHVVKELEEKIISAVELLIRFKERRDAARQEHENATREVQRLKTLAKMEAAGLSWSKILEFSFMEIIEATNNFEPSRKIGEGRYGTVYKGILRYVCVAIKMLPSYGSNSLLDFQKGVEVLSRVRHPNLVTLIGTCPESRSLVYEYVRNGSLEDRLNCKDNAPALPWQTRIQVAIQICSALIFLHSNRPCIIHGNLAPSNVLLDANFICKLCDFGIYHLIPPIENKATSGPRWNKSTSNFSSMYDDPEYLETGTLTPEADVYSLGLVLLRLLTGRPVSGVVKDAKCALDKENFKTVLDSSAGTWPLEQAKELVKLALKCCDKNRANLVSEIRCVLESMKGSDVDGASCLSSKEAQKIPSHFVCPIFQEVMKDPQIAADGFTYDGDAIKGWLKSGHNTSPMTNLKLEHCNLLPNHALHQAILEWKQRW